MVISMGPMGFYNYDFSDDEVMKLFKMLWGDVWCITTKAFGSEGYECYRHTACSQSLHGQAGQFQCLTRAIIEQLLVDLTSWTTWTDKQLITQGGRSAPTIMTLAAWSSLCALYVYIMLYYKQDSDLKHSFHIMLKL